jgi:TfoX/Sxy family transcriptional regulator of competence genes
MANFEKSPTELINIFNHIVRNFPQVTVRKTFGYPCAYLNGHMAAGLFADSMFLRLNLTDESEFLNLPGAASFAPMQGRPMKGYVVVPPLMVKPGDFLQAWFSRCLEYVATLPPKGKKR